MGADLAGKVLSFPSKWLLKSRQLWAYTADRTGILDRAG